MSRLTILVGNPKAASRTLTVAETVADVVGLELDEGYQRSTFDLAHYASHVFDSAFAELNAMADELAGSDLIIVASPTYKATYSGLLKGFLDRYMSDALSGVVAVPVMVGASPVHALAPEAYLRPLLVELGATVPTRSLFLLESQVDETKSYVEKWAFTARPLISAALSRPR